MENFDINKFISDAASPANLLIAADILRYTSLFLALSKYFLLPLTFFGNLMHRDIDVTHLKHSNMIPYLQALNI